MPQMSPMNWIFLYLFFSIILYLTMVKIFFSVVEKPLGDFSAKESLSSSFKMII
uniref:ATP synthase subunit 8 n=1 Tax=Lovenula raynerae TaxID=2487506 RepID=A0A3G4YLI9_9MAXI|nr:ATP synthase subunit 8 [Lovenula raynerae]